MVGVSTSCSRGYVAKWELKNKKLYLIDFKGQTSNFKNVLAGKETINYWEVGMDFIFPNQERVFAEWFSGELRIPLGRRLYYEHRGYNSIFDADVFLKFKNGQFIESRTVDNFDRAVELRKKEEERDREKKKEIEAKRNVITKRKSFLTKLKNFWKRKD